MRLGDICNAHSGYTARGKLEPLPEGGVPAMQLRDISGDSPAISGNLSRYDLVDISDHYFVRGGEVVFRPRGEPNTAIAVHDGLVEPVAVVVPLVIIRPKKANVLPDYLAWAINQPAAQRQLAAEAQGTSLRMIPMTALEGLDIPIPDIITQRQIVELNILAQREARLLRELAAKREDRMIAILGKAALKSDKKEMS